MSSNVSFSGAHGYYSDVRSGPYRDDLRSPKSLTQFKDRARRKMNKTYMKQSRSSEGSPLSDRRSARSAQIIKDLKDQARALAKRGPVIKHSFLIGQE